MRTAMKTLWVLLAALVVGLMLTLAFPPKARAQVDPICPPLAEMAYVARVLAIEKIEPEQAKRIMHAIYSGPAMTPDLVAVMDSTTVYARQFKEDPAAFAELVFAMCTTRGKPS